MKGLYDQFRAQNFSSVPGNITHSRLAEEHDSGETSERAEITYDYFVGREKYSCDDVHFGMMGMGNTREYVNRFTPGSETPVY